MTAEPTPYPRIGDLAAIGDGQSMALLGREGQVGFFCPLRFDAAPLVWPLLDRGDAVDVHAALRLQDASLAGASRTRTSGQAAEVAAAGQPGSPGGWW